MSKHALANFSPHTIISNDLYGHLTEIGVVKAYNSPVLST